MITGPQTNKVFISDLIRTESDYKATYEQLTSILEKHGVPYDTIEGTKDIWCRDYMPIQVKEDRFIQFRYEPSYLKRNAELRTITSQLNGSYRQRTIDSTLNFDGGNVVGWNNKAIITERVFNENKNLTPQQVIKRLEELFELRIYTVPDIYEDMTGHVDGHLRFIDEDTVLVNKLAGEHEYWTRGFLKMVKEAKLDYVEMPWFNHRDSTHQDSAIGVYVNYLEVDDLIVFPVFEVADGFDENALDVICKVFPHRKIEPIVINSIANNGGLINCCTWTIKESSLVR